MQTNARKYLSNCVISYTQLKFKLNQSQFTLVTRLISD